MDASLIATAVLSAAAASAKAGKKAEYEIIYISGWAFTPPVWPHRTGNSYFVKGCSFVKACQEQRDVGNEAGFTCRKFLYLLQKDSHNNEESIMPMRREKAGNALDPWRVNLLEAKERIEERLYWALIAAA